MPKSTVEEMPAPARTKQAQKQQNVWPQGIPVVGDLEAETFPEWLASTTEEDWNKYLICYLWRCEPITDRKAGGGPISIDILTRKFDSKEILKLHGSGRYRFDISYRPSDGGKQKRVRQDYETIFDLEMPPKIALGEWLDDPRNKDWSWAKPQLEAEEKRRVMAAAAAIAPPSAAPQSEAEKFSELMQVFQQFMPKSGENQVLLLELMKQNDPAKMLEMAKGLAELRQPPQDNGNNAMMLMLMKHILDKQAPPAADPLESTAKLMTGFQGLFEKMGMMNPGAAAAPQKLDTAGLVVQGLGDVLGKALEQFGPYVPNFIEMIRFVKDRDLQIAQVAAARGMNPAAPYQYVGGPGNPAAPHNPAPIAAPQPQPSENAPMTPQVFFAKHQALLGEMFPQLKDWFDNEDGYFAADWIIDRKGRDAYNAIRKDASVDLLMQIAGGVPQLAAIFQPPEDARVFFVELLCDPDNRPPEEEEHDQEDGAII